MSNYVYIDPWSACDTTDTMIIEPKTRDDLANKLQLPDLKIKLLARRYDQDELLFQIEDGSERVIAVHPDYKPNGVIAGSFRVYESWVRWKEEEMDNDNSLINELRREGVLLGDMLQRSNDFYWGNFILMCRQDEISAQTKILEVGEDLNAEVNPVEQGIIVEGKTYTYVMSIQDMQSIVENAKQQKNNISVDELVEAFKYYYEHDAYIEFA